MVAISAATAWLLGDDDTGAGGWLLLAACALMMVFVEVPAGDAEVLSLSILQVLLSTAEACGCCVAKAIDSSADAKMVQVLMSNLDS